MNFTRLDLDGYLIVGKLPYKCKLILQDGIVHRVILQNRIEGKIISVFPNKEKSFHHID